MEQEIDLRKYVEVVLGRSRWIAALSLVSAIAAFVTSSLLPSMYEAKANLVVQGVYTDVTLVSSIRTEESSALRKADLDLRLQVFRDLAESAAVAAAVLEQLQDRLGGTVADKSQLRDMVHVTSKADLITIKAQARHPQLAADVASEWARQAEKHINAIYGQSRQQTQSLQMQDQFTQARERYQVHQDELEAYLVQNPVPELQYEVSYHEQLIDKYQQVLVGSESTVYSRALVSKRDLLLNTYQELELTERILVDARTLQQELQRPSTAEATDWARALTFVGLQNRSTAEEKLRLDIALVGDAPDTSKADLDWLINILENKVVELESASLQQEGDLFSADLVVPAAELASPLRQQIQTLVREMTDLQSQLEAARARKLEIVQSRDLAWETYQAIARKLAENEMESQVSDSEVRFAFPAVKPDRPINSNRTRNTAAGGAVGFAVGVFAALFTAYWQQAGVEKAAGLKPASVRDD